MIILFNGKFIPARKAVVPIYSETFMYGFGVFETLRTYKRKVILKAKEHVDRLFKSAAIIGLAAAASKESILKNLEKVVQKSPYNIQRIKLILAKEGVMIMSQRLKIDKNLARGVSLKTIVRRRSFPEAKTLSFIDSYVSHREAEATGFFEALLIGDDSSNSVYEGSYSNVFWFEDEVLCTRKNDVLPGITCQTVLEISPFKTKFKTISKQELVKKKELFITQTTNGILPVVKVDNFAIGGGKPGKNTARLVSCFKKYVEEYDEK